MSKKWRSRSAQQPIQLPPRHANESDHKPAPPTDPQGPAARGPRAGDPATEANAPPPAEKTWWERRGPMIEGGFKAIQAVAVVAGVVIGLYQYWDQFEKKAGVDKDQREREVKLRWYEERRPIYLAACDAAGDIAAAPTLKDPDALKAATRFQSYYYGRMCLVEDEEIMDCMVIFDQLLRKELPAGGPPSPDLKGCALRLADACRRALDLKSVFNATDVAIQPKLPDRPKNLSGVTPLW